MRTETPRFARLAGRLTGAALVGILPVALASCGGESLGVATTVVQVTPTNFATIPAVSSTLPGVLSSLPPGAIGQETTYTVKSGDTPIGVASMYGLSLTTLLAYNGWVTSSQFPFPGETIRIPPSAVLNGSGGTGGTTNSSTPSGPAKAGCGTRSAGTYKVQSGDSLYKIKDKFCISMNGLLAANGWSSTGVTIKVGDVINIPASGS